MILVDSSVWIDFFRDEPTAQVRWLDENLETESLVVGNLILAGLILLHNDRDFDPFEKRLGLRVVKCAA